MVITSPLGTSDRCEFDGLVLPLFGDAEKDWPNIIRLILYLFGLGWIFLGVAVISDIFMEGIEKITSSKKRVYNKATARTVTVYVWNDTVANLTLMALGSSAPEILLSLIEITTANFMLGPLGAGTIVGSAAFNLLIISAVCVMAIPDGEVRYIKELPVYYVTASCSVFAYLWLMFILMASSPDVCEAWEAGVTLLFCPLLVLAAYMADRGYFSSGGSGSRAYEEQQSDGRAIPDDVTTEELQIIEQEIRQAAGEHGEQLTSAQVIKIMQASYFHKKSRAYYRHKATEAAVYGKQVDTSTEGPPDLMVSEMFGAVDDIAGEKKLKSVEIAFEIDKYCFLENCGQAKVILTRSGPKHCKATVKYTCREGTAKAETDYTHVEGTLTFEKDQTEIELLITIKDDVAFEDDEEFYIDLFEPQVEDTASCEAKLGEIAVCTVVIIDDDQPGQLRFSTEEMFVIEGTVPIEVDVVVDRFEGATGAISCSYYTEDMAAKNGIDYNSAHGTLEFAHNVHSATFKVTINPRGRLDKAGFNCVLTSPKGCKFDEKTDGGEEKCICHVIIKGCRGQTQINLIQEMKARAISANQLKGRANWSTQFADALFKIGDDDEEDEDSDEPSEKSSPSCFDWCMHIAALPWKLLFAFVPPVDYCGGWSCFCASLLMIAVVTALVSDMANLVGCCIGLLPETCAITFVALGTSLPDTFASKTAAMMDPYADASIGNVTGSNSINVFMGIGLAWSLAAFKWQFGEKDDNWLKGYTYLTDGQKENVINFLGKDPMLGGDTAAIFITPAGSIWFNLMVFSANALFALQHLSARRRKWGGELGGPLSGWMGQKFSAGFLVLQWFIYIAASTVFARVVADPLTYGQMAEQSAAPMVVLTTAAPR